MKLLQVEIGSCFGCPYYHTPSDDKVQIDWCYLAGMLIKDVDATPIPKWCPLPDVKGEK